MDGSGAAGECLVFPPFRLDPSRRLLTHDGRIVPLTPTVSATLTVLARNAGRVVTKDELIETVWGGRMVGESTISQTVFTLRKALLAAGALEPVIATVSGRGYRFTAPVRREGLSIEAQAPAAPGAHANQVIRRPSAMRLSMAILPVAVAAAPAIFAVLVLARPLARPVGAPAETVVQVNFQNHANDPLFDRTLAKVVEIDLGQSPWLSVLTERQVDDTLVMMNRPRDTPLGPAVAREVCLRNNAQATVEGSVAPMGRRYLITLTATDCRDGRRLSAEKAFADSRDGVIPALDRVIIATRRRLGEAAASVKRFDIPLLQGKTGSLEALQAYSQGVRAADHGRGADAIVLLQRAVTIDPGFAAAHLELARSLFNTGRYAESRAAMTRAYQLKGSANEEMAYSIAILHSMVVDLDYPKALGLAKAATDLFPDHLIGWGQQANIDLQFGRYRDAVAAARRELALGAGREGAYFRLAQALMGDGRLAEAEQVCRAATEHRVAGGMIAVARISLALARDDAAGLEREVRDASGQSWEPDVLVVAALGAYRSGRMAKGDALFERAAALDRAAGAEGYFTGQRAMTLMLAGERDAALKLVTPLPVETKVMSLSLINTLYVLEEAGDVRRAGPLLSLAAQRGPSDTILNVEFAPTARATLDLVQRRPGAALADLAPAAVYEARDNAVPFLRGRIDLALGDGAGAAREFAEIIDHPGVDPWDIRHPLAWLNLARARRLMGREGDSRAAYRKFFAL